MKRGLERLNHFLMAILREQTPNGESGNLHDPIFGSKTLSFGIFPNSNENLLEHSHHKTKCLISSYGISRSESHVLDRLTGIEFSVNVTPVCVGTLSLAFTVHRPRDSNSGTERRSEDVKYSSFFSSMHPPPPPVPATPIIENTAPNQETSTS
jgi:hypothetical protein